MAMRSIITSLGLTMAFALGVAAKDQTKAPLEDTEKIKFEQAISNIPGKKFVAVEVDYPPGAKSVSHHHASSAFIYAYVLKGAVKSQVDDEAVKVYSQGESWYEAPGVHHKISENNSATEPAKLLAVFVVDSGAKATDDSGPQMMIETGSGDRL